MLKAGVPLEKPLIIYVGSGGRSSLVIFTLHRLGIEARHYVHGITDWKRNPAHGSWRAQSLASKTVGMPCYTL